MTVLAHIEAARGGDVSGNEEEGNEEGCQEEEVSFAVRGRWGASPPSSTHNFILPNIVRQG